MRTMQLSFRSCPALIQERYQLPWMRSDSPKPIFSNLTVPMNVAPGVEFRMRYIEDLRDRSESDNGGET